MSKPKILLCWGYHRIDWIDPFVRLKNSFEFTFISFFNKPENENEIPFEKLYWSDFKSADQIIELTEPSKIIFMSIDTGFSVSLSYSARKHKVETLVMQHGLFHDYEFYRQQEILSKKSKFEEHFDYTPSWKITLAFLFRSVGFSHLISFLRIVLTLIVARKFGRNLSLKHFSNRFFRADKYLCYTRYNGRVYTSRDKIDDENIIEIGNPSYDPFFEKRKESNCNPERYFLLIDQPLAENPFTSFSITKDEMNEFYSKLNAFCKLNSAALYIKLHPESYNSNFMIQDPNITYYKDADVVMLIKNSLGCFGFFSSVIVPATYFKRCTVFKLKGLKSETQDDLIASDFVSSDDFEKFDPERLKMRATNVKNRRQKFTKKYLYKADGKSIFRLKEVLDS